MTGPEADDGETVHATGPKRTTRRHIVVAGSWQEFLVWCQDQRVLPGRRDIILVVDREGAQRIRGLFGPARGGDAELHVTGTGAYQSWWPELAKQLGAAGLHMSPSLGGKP